jgi:hypothetical protein
MKSILTKERRLLLQPVAEQRKSFITVNHDFDVLARSHQPLEDTPKPTNSGTILPS